MGKETRIYIRKGGVDVARYDGDSHRLSSVKVDASITTPEKILEEAVYADPTLLESTGTTTVVADCSRFAIVPSCTAGDPFLTARQLWPDGSGAEEYMDEDAVLADRTAKDTAVLWLPGKKMLNFVRRTFADAVLCHRLSVLIDFFARQSAPVNRVKIYACFSDTDRLDIVALTADKLLMANTFDCNDAADAFYFIMAAAEDCGFDALEDELLLYGDTDRSTAATATLRKYFNSVMPLLVPDNIKELPPELTI